ncbi:hypothetical protein BGZ94_004035 [Podila epigama]|nr:hypothetical protein BGZ94_004035 [Podila epigama]
MRSPSLAVFITLVGAWISTGCDNSLVNAAPISQLVARQPASGSLPPPTQQLRSPPPHPSLGRIQIKAPHSTLSHINRIATSTKSLAEEEEEENAKDNEEKSPEGGKWYVSEHSATFQHLHRASLHGHAIVDDEDDDAGNELLDTELDGLLRPDEDDEVEGTIEGQILEEEEEEDDDEGYVDDEEDDDSEEAIEAEEARIREIYAAEVRRRRQRDEAAAILSFEEEAQEEEDELLEEVQDQAEEDEEEAWLANGLVVPDDIEDDVDDAESAELLSRMSSTTTTTTTTTTNNNKNDHPNQNTRFQVVVSRFGGKAAAADLAAGLD